MGTTKKSPKGQKKESELEKNIREAIVASRTINMDSLEEGLHISEAVELCSDVANNHYSGLLDAAKTLLLFSDPKQVGYKRLKREIKKLTR